MRAQGIARGHDVIERWVGARAEQLPFAAGSFDGAVLFTALEFVAEPVRAIEQTLRVIRPDGWLCVGYLNALSAWAAAYRRYGERGKQPWVGARFFVREDLEQMVGRAADRSESAVRLSPAAIAPFAAADAAGERAGNVAAMDVLLWRRIR
jgi:ubiquinone/menaquinone biosynthesis C-methylase UbiE